MNFFQITCAVVVALVLVNICIALVILGIALITPTVDTWGPTNRADAIATVEAQSAER